MSKQELIGSPLETAPDRKQRQPRLLPTLLSLLLGMLLLAMLANGFNIDLDELWSDFRNSHLGLYLLALFAHYCTFPFRGSRWALLIRNAQNQDNSGLRPRWFYCARLILLSWFINCVSGFRLGDAYRAYIYANENRATFSHTMGTILAERVIDILLVFMLLILAVVSLWLGTGQNPSPLLLGLSALLAIGAATAIIGMLFVKEPLIQRLPRALSEPYRRFHQGTVGSFRQLHLGFGLGLLAWLAEFARLLFVSRALNVSLSAPMILFVTLANALLTLIPLTPGGIGIVEPGITGLLMLSLSKNQAVSITLLDRSISYLSILISGGALFLIRIFWNHQRSSL